MFPDAKEYCLTDTFEARCNAADEVVLVKSAMYGRMRPGRCVQQNYGYIGCHTDVTRVIATRCSGRSRCEITNLEAELATYQNCPADLKVYLDANYTCIKGRHGTHQSVPIPACPTSTRLILHQFVPHQTCHLQLFPHLFVPPFHTNPSHTYSYYTNSFHTNPSHTYSYYTNSFHANPCHIYS